MNQENLDRMYARLKAIKWYEPIKPRRIASGKLLIQEFLRRTTLWNRALQDPISYSWMLSDLASLVKPEIVVDWEGFSEIHIPDRHTKTCCFFAYKWAAIEDTLEIQVYNLPHPYEPLLMACDGGIGFSREENILDLYSYHFKEGEFLTFDSKAYERDEPFIELDEAVLDRIDQQES